MQKWKFAVSCAENSPRTAPLPLEGSLQDCMKQAAFLGYNGVEFHTRETYSPDVASLQHIETAHRVQICSIVTGRLLTQSGHSLLDADPASERMAVSGMRKYIDMASETGADIVIGWAKGTIPAGAEKKLYQDRLAKHLMDLAAYGKRSGVKLFLEVINHYETNLFTTAKETLAFFEAYQLENCYIHLDTYHMCLEELDLFDAIQLCRGKLGYLHVADNSRRYPGSGQIDFKRIFSVLEEIEYDGWITVECLPDPDGVTAARKAIDYLKVCEQARYSATLEQSQASNNE